jgi:hypothetical protein
MSADFTPITELIKKSEDVEEPRNMINDSFISIGWKSKILLFLIFLLICSTMFIENVIGKFGSDMIYDTRSTTNKGTIIQGILLVLIYSIMESFVSNKIL